MDQLFVVDWIYSIPSRGVLLSPGVSIEDYERVESGDEIELRLPSGKVFRTRIAGFYHSGKPNSLYHRTWDILLEQNVTKDDIDIGTEVWLVTP